MSHVRQPRVRILNEIEDYQYEGRFKIIRAELQYRRRDGEMSEPVTRLNFERGSAVAVLLYDPTADAVLLVRQFRYPVYASLPSIERAGSAEAAWLLEIVAGIEEPGQDAEETAHREVNEEVGYEIRGQLEQIASVYASPGASSERVTVFLAEVDSGQRRNSGGGLAAEGEDTELVTLPRAEALAMLARGEIRDAKTALALQYLALRQGAATEMPRR